MGHSELFLIHARWILPVEPAGEIFEHHCVVVENGRIREILPSSDATQRYSSVPFQRYSNHILIPGLINAHTHAAMVLLRGLADDLPLMTWLNEHIWPAESRWVNSDFVRAGTMLAAAEMLVNGVTCFNDMYFFPEDIAQSAICAGIRACVGLIVLDFPTAWAKNADHYLAKAKNTHQKLHHPLIRSVLAPHAPYTVSDQALEQVRELSSSLDLPIHIHVHETEQEIIQSQLTCGDRPLARLARLGLLSPKLVAVHMTQLMEEEIALCMDKGVHVVHCPESNLKLAAGFCPVAKLLDAGVNVALGTDGAASNNDLNLLGEMRTAALLAKAVARDAAALSAHGAIHLATLAGARALGLADEIGSLLPGKYADLVAVDLSGISSVPIYHPVSALVYATPSTAVTDVWVAGRHVVANRTLTALHIETVLSDVQIWAERIAKAENIAVTKVASEKNEGI